MSTFKPYIEYSSSMADRKSCTVVYFVLNRIALFLYALCDMRHGGNVALYWTLPAGFPDAP